MVTSLLSEKSETDVDFDYFNSNRFYRMRELATQKIRRHIWNEHNNLINEKVREIVDKGLQITQTAYEKLEHIIGEYGKITSEIHHLPYELALYLLTDKEKAKQGEPIVCDVYIAQEQIVYPSYCIISGEGSIMSMRDVKDNLEKRISGWGHSHGDFHTFFSQTDKVTFDHFLDDYKMFNRLKFIHYDHKHEYLSEDTFGLVMNVKKEKPFAALNISFPEYLVDNEGKVQVIKKKRRFDDIKLNVVDNNPYTPSDGEKKQIIDELKSRVRLGANGRLLGEYEAAIPETNKDRILETLKNKKRRLMPVSEESNNKLLNRRITDLESVCNSLKTDNESLLKKYQTLQEKVSYLEMQPINKGLNYSSQINDYYTKLTKSENKAEQLLGKISKIMAGQYHANLQDIKGGNFEEDSVNTRIWKWEERLEAIMQIYNQNKDLVSQLNNGLIERLREILNSNRYLKKKHPNKLKQIFELFS
jgi:hypothetical protein